MKMKLHHTAALALVGWYLMMPPRSPGAKSVDLGADLSLWGHWNSYVTAAECRRELDKLRVPLTRKYDYDMNGVLRRGTIFEQMAYFARCVATDDPRLKEK
jgi:hypothetical protein